MPHGGPHQLYGAASRLHGAYASLQHQLTRHHRQLRPQSRFLTSSASTSVTTSSVLHQASSLASRATVCRLEDAKTCQLASCRHRPSSGCSKAAWRSSDRNIFLRNASSAATSVPPQTAASKLPPLHAQQIEIKAYNKQRRKYTAWKVVAFIAGGTLLAYWTVPSFRRYCIGSTRIARVAQAVLLCIADYKLLFRTEWDDPAVRHNDYKACHKRCAERILAVLKKNGGIFVKLGQHLSSVQLVPEEWSTTMRPLQDHCFPTPLPDVQKMFLEDIGEPIENLFSDFAPTPIGVASLAQVHVATDKISERKVAVKLMHPELREFMLLDMQTVTFFLKVVKFFFPTFEFTWLGEEMEQNLPLEMDFRHEAANAKHCEANFAKLRKTSLVVPEVLWSQERILVMEFIEGGRVDDLEYLAKHKIDRNAVSCEISRIFSQMLFIDGCFHGDPHAGNLLIRPVPLTKRLKSRSRHNFEIVLLDHGLWFDISRSLRTNYARLWLSLLRPKTEEVDADRRKYAQLVGNIGPDLFPIFEAAITGRAGLSEAEFESGGLKNQLEGSLLGLASQSKEDAQRLRNAFMQEGIMSSIFELLRRVPRRLLMVLKINDLTRSLDKALNPSHPPWRIWVIVARYCALSAYLDDMDKLRRANSTVRGFARWSARFGVWLNFELWYRGLGFVERLADAYARWNKMKAYWTGLIKGGLAEARKREAGILREIPMTTRLTV